MKLSDDKRKELYGLANIQTRFLDVHAPNRLKASMKPDSITIHETDNVSKGADSEAHARYMGGADAQKRKVSWHFTVCSKQTVKHLPTSLQAWHSGNPVGNASSVAIEMCVNADGDYHATLKRTAALVAILIDAHDDMKISGKKLPVKPHKFWSGKQCPGRLLGGVHGVTWDDFLEMVREHFALPANVPFSSAEPVD